MSGSRGNKIEAYAIPTAPLVDERGMITTTWYRLIVSLIARTGGTAGKVTPSTVEPQTVLMGLLTEGSPSAQAQDLAGGLSLGSVEKDVAQPLLLERPQPVPVQQFTPAPQWQGPGREYFPTGRGVAPAADTVTPGASPYSYAPGFAGACIVQGGTVSAISISRDGTTFITTGMTAGMFPLEANDTLRVTYTVVPTMTFLRRAS